MGGLQGRKQEAPHPIGEVAQRPALHGVACFHSAMVKFAGPRLPLVMKALLGAHSSVYEVQRVTSTAFLAEVGAACLGLPPWVQQGMGNSCTGRH